MCTEHLVVKHTEAEGRDRGRVRQQWCKAVRLSHRTATKSLITSVEMRQREERDVDLCKMLVAPVEN